MTNDLILLIETIENRIRKNGFCPDRKAVLETDDLETVSRDKLDEYLTLCLHGKVPKHRSGRTAGRVRSHATMRCHRVGSGKCAQSSVLNHSSRKSEGKTQ